MTSALPKGPILVTGDAGFIGSALVWPSSNRSPLLDDHLLDSEGQLI